jgi:hypothetical protein
MSHSIQLSQQIFKEILVSTMQKAYEDENVSIHEIMEEIKIQMVTGIKELALESNI